jgi:hypothetical protein
MRGLNWDGEAARRKVSEHGSDRIEREHIPRRPPPKQRMIKNAQRRELKDLGFKAPGTMTEKRAARTIDRLRLLGVTRSEIAKRSSECTGAGPQDRLRELQQRLEEKYLTTREKTIARGLTDAEREHDLAALETARRNLTSALYAAGLHRENSGPG